MIIRRRDGMEPSDHTACHTASASGQCSEGIDEVFTPLPDATVRGSHLSDEPAPSALFFFRLVEVSAISGALSCRGAPSTVQGSVLPARL